MERLLENGPGKADQGGMGQRPSHIKAPDYLSKSPPVPKPKKVGRAPEPDPERLDPVRYGDWELKGVAVDF